MKKTVFITVYILHSPKLYMLLAAFDLKVVV